MDKGARIYVAGHNGLVGSALVRQLDQAGYTQLIVRNRDELDLTDQASVTSFFSDQQPEYVFLAAAKVGGILANKMYGAEFIYENLQIQNNVIHQSYLHDAKRLLFLGSSCIYPKLSSQPLREDYLLTGELEKTNEAYAVAKIAGLKLCEFYKQQYGFSTISVMPTNLYGPNDNFDLETSHVLPAMLRKFHDAKLKDDAPVTLWGTGTPRREFLHVDDAANACLYLMNLNENQLTSPLYNIGTGEDITIKDLATLVQTTVGHRGDLKWDTSKPDGTPRKLLNVDILANLGWHASIGLQEGLRQTYEWFERAAAPVMSEMN